MGAEGIKSERSLRKLLADNPDLAARFAPETAGRLILSDPDHIESHGPFLFQKLSVDADRGDAISFREGHRLLEPWLQARRDHQKDKKPYDQPWTISASDISSQVEATLKLRGPAAALQALEGWRPKQRIALQVALTLPYRLIAEGRGSDVDTLAKSDLLEPIQSLFLLIPLALAGRPVEVDQIASGLEGLFRRKLRLKQLFEAFETSSEEPSTHGQVLDAVLTASELLTIQDAAPELVDDALASFLSPDLRQIERRYTHETLKLHLLFRAYTLREYRAGRLPKAEGLFEPRPDPGDNGSRRQKDRAEEHDRGLLTTTRTVLGMYSAVADAFVNRRTDAELEAALSQACDTIEREPWGISPEYVAPAMRGLAAKNVATLLAAGHAPAVIKLLATRVHGRWQAGGGVPNSALVSRLSLWPQLHDSLVDDLSAAAEATRTMRIGANEKTEALVRYARYMEPLSGSDANAIFNSAIEAANDLDREIMAQISLLNKLVRRGMGHFETPRQTARRFSNVVADAAVRLEGYDDFPWNDAMTALARLDVPLALANLARWHDEGIVGLWETLAAVLKTALTSRTISPQQAAALTLFIGHDGGVMADALKQSGDQEDSVFVALAEEAAHDVLIRDGCGGRGEIVQCVEQRKLHGPWSDALLHQESFLAGLPLPETNSHDDPLGPDTNAEDPLNTHVWNRKTLIDSQLLQEAAHELANRERVGPGHIPFHAIFESARRVVSPGDRVRHLKVLAELDEPALAYEATEALIHAANEWWAKPSVRAWCRGSLAEIIVTRFPELTRYLGYGEDHLTPALERTGLSDAALHELILRGVERHVDGLYSETLFELAGMIGGKMAQSEAAELVDWYTRRLAERIPVEDRDQTTPGSVLPERIDEAVARFIFAYMGDCDLRLRWRAAHAVRRLARTGDEATLTALVADYDRREDPAFRGRDVAFYWLAARLWFVVAWDRVAIESPAVAACASHALFKIALDDSFPHLLVRAFARDACEKLVTAGHLSLNDAEYSHLMSVNETPFAPVSTSMFKRTSGRNAFAQSDQGRRFEFDLWDTPRYWYEPMLESFAHVDFRRFLQEAEHWIIDVWDYPGDIRAFSKERRRRGRFHDRDWALSSHGHGSIPTLERLNTHLEWHAMWCAAGELLKTEPLASYDEASSWELTARVRDAKLVEPPLWSADLLVSPPLEPRYWRPDTDAVEDWVLKVGETTHRTEIFPSDSPDCVVVDSSSERRMGDRRETTRICSALVEPATGRSLLRALQTMDDSWDYRLPDEGEEDAEIDETPYRLLGWLRSSSRDSGIDKKDPLRGYAFGIDCRPGKRVVNACSLKRDEAGQPRWSNRQEERPMFIYEAWGEPEKDDYRYTEGFALAGRRLRAHKEQLLNFLHGQGLDLIIEVEVTRRGRETRRYADEERKPTPEARFARLYRLDNRGRLEVAEGHLGTWTGDRPTT